MSASDASKLGYPPAWIEYGLLDSEFVAEQLAQFAQDDADPEHYRWAAYLRVLERPHWSEQLVDHFIELARLDPSPTLRTSALIQLIEHPSLSQPQFERLAGAIEGDPAAERRYRRAGLRRRVAASPTDAAVVEQCVRDADASLQRELLERLELPSELLQYLRREGRSRAVRNLAVERERQRKQPR